MNRLIIFLLVSASTLGCSDDEQTCESISGFSYSHYRCEEIELGNRKKTSFGSEGLNQGGEEVDFDLFFMEIYFDHGTYAYMGPDKTGQLVRIDDHLDLCAPNHRGYIQQLEGISFTTNFDYNDEFKAGDSINDLIILNRDSESKTMSLNDYLAQKERPINYINSYHLSEPPSDSKAISIRVELALEPGGYFESTALSVKLK